MIKYYYYLLHTHTHTYIHTYTHTSSQNLEKHHQKKISPTLELSSYPKVKDGKKDMEDDSQSQMVLATQEDVEEEGRMGTVFAKLISLNPKFEDITLDVRMRF
jgi:hypothetical protein